MKHTFKLNTGKWFIVSGLMLLLSVTSIGNALAVDLSDAEKDSLTFMREEEKLARDVYQYLYGIWGTPIFSNIAVSEQTHMNAVKTLLDRYDIADPVSELAGEFNNAELQALYDQLVAKGSASLVEALETGVLIEEADIIDLQAGLDLTTRKDITIVYSNLMRGSYNHLGAFKSNLARLGIETE
jgi:hypothetical protein